MRMLSYIGIGAFVVTVGYGLMGWAMYDFRTPAYEEEGNARIIEEIEIDGIHYWTWDVTWQFTGYGTGEITRIFAGNETAYRIYFGIEPAFRPLAWIVRHYKGHPYRMESHESRTSDPGIVSCNRAHCWVLDLDL